MHPKFALFALPLLAACSTPLEQCQKAASEDLSIVSALIAETEQNIDRGYAIETRVEYRPTLTFCYTDKFSPGDFFFTYCNEIEPQTVSQPVAIDLAAERAKLAELRKKEAELRRRTADALAQCAATYPPEV